MIESTFINNIMIKDYTMNNLNHDFLVNEMLRYIRINGPSKGSEYFYKGGCNSIENLIKSLNDSNYCKYSYSIDKDVFKNSYNKVKHNDFNIYLMQKYHFLDLYKRKLFIECCVIFAESLFDILMDIFTEDDDGSARMIMIDYFFEKIDNSEYTDIFLKACALIPYATDIPNIVSDLKTHKYNFEYNVNKRFFLIKRLLNLLDFESLLKDILLGNNEQKQSKILDRVNFLDELVEKKLLRHRSQDGKYLMNGNNIKVICNEILKIAPHATKETIFEYVLQTNGSELSIKYLRTLL